MDYRTAVRDIGNMDAKAYRNYFDMDNSAGDVPENAEDYYSFSDTKDIGEGKVSTKTAAPKDTGAMSKMNGPDQPAAEPGEAPGAEAVKDYSEFRQKYGLEYNEDHAKMKSPGAYSRSSGGDGFASDDGAIFTEAGVYVGTAKGTENEDGDMVYDNYGSLKSASEGIKTKAEGKGYTDFSSLSDVAGAVHWLTKGDKAEAKTGEKPKYNKSDKLARAEAGVAAFEETILPYQGDIITGRKPDYAQEYADQFKVNLRNDPDYSWKFEGEKKGETEDKKKGIEFTGGM